MRAATRPADQRRRERGPAPQRHAVEVTALAHGALPRALVRARGEGVDQPVARSEDVDVVTVVAPRGPVPPGHVQAAHRDHPGERRRPVLPPVSLVARRGQDEQLLEMLDQVVVRGRRRPAAGRRPATFRRSSAPGCRVPGRAAAPGPRSERDRTSPARSLSKAAPIGLVFGVFGSRAAAFTTCTVAAGAVTRTQPATNVPCPPSCWSRPVAGSTGSSTSPVTPTIHAWSRAAFATSPVSITRTLTSLP